MKISRYFKAYVEQQTKSHEIHYFTSLQKLISVTLHVHYKIPYYITVPILRSFEQ